MSTEIVGGVGFTVDADTSNAVKSVKEVEKQAKSAEKSLSGLDKATGKTEKSFNKLATQTTKTAKAVNAGVAGMGRKAGQAGIQVQQFIGQIQGGQNAMLALSAQSADLGFVLGAPLIGAIAGISASIVGLLLPSLMDSTTEAEKLEKAIEALDKMTYEASDGTLKLSESMEKLASKSKEVAKVELALGIAKAKEALISAKKSIDEASESWESFFGFTDSKAAISELESLEKAAKRTGKTQIEVMKEMGDTNLGARLEISLITQAVEDLGEEYGMTETQALGFMKSLKQVSETGSAESMMTLAGALGDVAVQAEKPNKKLLELAQKVGNASMSATNAAEVISLFESALNDLDGALEKNSEGASKLSSKVGAMTVALSEQAKQLGENNRETAIRIALENKATQAQIDSINTSYDKIEAFEREEEAAKKKIKTDKEAAQEQAKQIKVLGIARANEFKKMDAIRKQAEDDAKSKSRDKDSAVTFTENIVSRGVGSDEAMAQEKAKIDEYLAEELISAQQHEDALTQIKREGEQQRLAAMNVGLSAASNLFGEMANLISSSGSEQSSAYKAMFALSKGFAIAQAGLNLSTAISNASAISPWYASVPAMASVASAGAGLASSIAGASYSGRENGGSVMAGQTYEMGEKNKPEMLVIPGNDGKVFSNAQMKSMMGGGNGGGAPVVNNYVAGNGVSVQTRRDELTQRDVIDIIDSRMGDPNSRSRRNLERTSSLKNQLNGSRR